MDMAYRHAVANYYTALQAIEMPEYLENLKKQGFTMGSNQSGTGFNTTTVLNTERLWQDKNAPQWGEGK